MSHPCADHPGILIMSCDNYCDLWEPFFHFLRKYWPACPYPVYLTTNSRVCGQPSIRHIHYGKPTCWTDELSASLKLFPHNYLIYMHDDYLLTHKVDNDSIASLFRKMLAYKADYLRLFPCPGPDQAIPNETTVGAISKGSAYRTSLQCAIWKKKTLMNLLSPGESAWDFEINSPSRSGQYFFLSVQDHKKGHIKNHTYPVTYFYKTGVFKGKWMREAAEVCLKEGLNLNFDYRKIHSNKFLLARKLYLLSPVFLQHIYDFTANKFKKLNRIF